MRALLVASTGGHMVQLESWSRRIAGLDSVCWAAAESPQSKTLLAGQHVNWIPDIQPRQLRETMGLLSVARKIVQQEKVDVVVSTGASVAIPFFVAARMYGAEGHYIESAARQDGPSITGQVAAVMPKVRCYTQSEAWADSRWKYAGWVFDGYEAAPVEAPKRPLRVVVTLGSMRHPMTRLVNQLNQVLPEDAEIVWQLGHTPQLAGMRASRIERFITHDELTELMSDSDVVVAHAGVGSAIQAMSVGKAPILVPRRIEHGEHVDEHQEQIARRLSGLGLATMADVENLTADTLLEAATRGVRRADSPSKLSLRSLRVAPDKDLRQPAVLSVPNFAEPVGQRRA
jgi:UDP-N-acetylglucosamine transferase subunit ALG13